MTVLDRIRERLGRLLLGSEPVDVDAALTHIASHDDPEGPLS